MSSAQVLSQSKSQAAGQDECIAPVAFRFDSSSLHVVIANRLHVYNTSIRVRYLDVYRNH
jgi:hypothetical protein